MPLRRAMEGTAREIADVFLEMRHTSDRVAAIACAAVLDDTLRATISRRFIRLGKDWEDRLFGDPGSPLGSFSAKILLGYAMGLIGSVARADLDLIRSIRNEFAHSAAPLTFDDPGVSVKCNRLSSRRQITDFDYPEWLVERIKQEAMSSRDKFIGASEWICWDLHVVRPRRLKAIYPTVLR